MSAVLILVIALFSLPLVLNGVAYAGRRWVLRGRRDCGEAAPLREAIAGFLTESAALALAIVHALWGRRPSTEPSAVHESCGTVVLIPGFGFEAAVFAVLEQRLRQSGWAPVTVKLPSWWLDLAASAESLNRSLYPLRSASRGAALIAFGVGGLVARHYLRGQQHGGIRCLITLGTPHQGTEAPWCRFGPLRRLRPDAEWLRALSNDDSVPRQIDVIAIYSDFDALVVPAERAYYPGAFNIEVRGVGHFSLVRSGRVWELIDENLRASWPHRS